MSFPPPPPPTGVILKEHQQQHARTLLRSLQTCGAAIDASPTGTGKTFVAAWIAEQLADHHIVIVCPTIVRDMWRSVLRIEHRDPCIFTYGMLTLAASRRGVLRPRIHVDHQQPSCDSPFPSASASASASPRLRLPQLRLDESIEAMLRRSKTLLIVDEAHRARHVGSQTSRALSMMCACVQQQQEKERGGGRGCVLALSATFMDSLGQIRVVPRLFPGSFEDFVVQNRLREEEDADPHDRLGVEGRHELAVSILCRIMGVPPERRCDWLLHARQDLYFSRVVEKMAASPVAARRSVASAEGLLWASSRPFCPFCVLDFLEQSSAVRSSMQPDPVRERKVVEDLYLQGADALDEVSRLRAVHAYLDASRLDRTTPIAAAPMTGPPPAAHLRSTWTVTECARIQLRKGFDFVSRTDWTLGCEEAKNAWLEAHERYVAEGRYDLAWSASVPLSLVASASTSRSASASKGLAALQEVEIIKAKALARHIASRLNGDNGRIKVVAMFNFLASMRACRRELEAVAAAVVAAAEAAAASPTSLPLPISSGNLRRRLRLREVREISGATPRRVRQEIVDRFRSSKGRGEGVSCILCTMGTMNEGVSLHDESKSGCSPRELYIMPNFSSISLVQASGRVHRENAVSGARVFCVYAQRDLGGAIESNLRRRLSGKKRAMEFLGTSASEVEILRTDVKQNEEEHGEGIMAADLRAWLVEEYKARMSVPIRERNEMALGKYRWLASRMRPSFSRKGMSYMWDPLNDG